MMDYRTARPLLLFQVIQQVERCTLLQLCLLLLLPSYHFGSIRPFSKRTGPDTVACQTGHQPSRELYLGISAEPVGLAANRNSLLETSAKRREALVQANNARSQL